MDYTKQSLIKNGLKDLQWRMDLYFRQATFYVSRVADDIIGATTDTVKKTIKTIDSLIDNYLPPKKN